MAVRCSRGRGDGRLRKKTGARSAEEVEGKVGLQRSLTEIRAEMGVVEEGKGRLDNSREDAEERMRMRGGVD